MGVVADNVLRFGPFVLEPANARLLRDGRTVALTPKAFDMLHFLAARPDKLVTKDELLSAVWPDVYVSDASVKVCVREIRQALGDDIKSPRYIETVHRRGYRFIARRLDLPTQPTDAVATSHDARTDGNPSPTAATTALIGRDGELARLTAAYDRATAGERQCLFVTGDAGTGKSALVGAFLGHLPRATKADATCVVLRGHCFEQFGGGEPYMPLWEALGRLAHEHTSPAIAALLARHAAAYHLTGTPPPASTPAASSPLKSATQHSQTMSERLLVEMADAVESLARESTVVLVIEDAHWADYSTLDLISALTRRRAPARLLVVATYRPADAGAADAPLRSVTQGLLAAGLARELPLRSLDERAVEQLLCHRFAGCRFPDGFARRLHLRTHGHPLFVVRLLDDLVEQGVLQASPAGWTLADADADTTVAPTATSPAAGLAILDTHIPQSVRAMIEAQLERLGDRERQAVEAGAVAGVAFSAAAVAAVLGVDVLEAEATCDDLVRRHRFLEPAGSVEWPDDTIASHYRFTHALYQNVAYDRVPVARRARMHHALAVRVEQAWGERAVEESAELAMHFEAARDWPRAARYLRSAAASACRQYAHREAVRYLRRALAAVDRLPSTERARHELDVLMALAVNLQVTEGYAAPDVEAVHARAYALCQSMPAADVRRTFPVLWSIWLFHKVRSDLRTAWNMAGQLLAMAREANEPSLLLQAHQAMCVTALCLGKPRVAQAHQRDAATIYDQSIALANTHAYGQDPGVATHAFAAVAAWIAGDEAEATRCIDRSVQLARLLRQPSSLVVATAFAAMLHQLRGDYQETARWAHQTLTVARAEGYAFWIAGGQVLLGWAQAMQPELTPEATEAAVEQIERGLEAWLATGSRTYYTYSLGLASDAMLRIDRVAQATAYVEEALAAAASLPEGLYEPELHRLKAACLVRVETLNLPAAKDCLLRAIATARAQEAAAFERAAVKDLVSLLTAQGEPATPDHIARQLVTLPPDRP